MDNEHGNAVATFTDRDPFTVRDTGINTPAEKPLRYTKGWLERRDERGACPPNRNARYGNGPKQNKRRNGRLMATLTERIPLTTKPTARAETHENAVRRWYAPKDETHKRGNGSHDVRVFRRSP